MPDIGASILVRLKNKAKASGVSYQQCLQLFFQEEFLRRLSKSRYNENLVLKGGLFIYTLTDFSSRATVDVDFLLRMMDSSIEIINDVISDILETPTGYNLVVFFMTKGTKPIAVQTRYPGVRTQIIGSIKNVRVPFDVDIGVGDVIVPKAQKRTVQTQLEGYEAPVVYTYSLESTIAEKFDAILQRFELTGRMKDFYDIYYLSRAFDFDGRCLQEAIIQTLSNRGTPYERDSFIRIVALTDDAGMQTKWRNFLKNIKGHELPFSEVMHMIDDFLHPIYSAIINEEEFFEQWSSLKLRWEHDNRKKKELFV